MRRPTTLPCGRNSMTAPVPAERLLAPVLELLEERLSDVEQVADDHEIRELRDRRVGVAVDADDRAGGLHADLVLDRARDAEREVKLGLDDLSGLADLLGVRDPPRVDRGPRGADRRAEGLGDVADELEALLSTDAAAARDDDPRFLER